MTRIISCLFAAGLVLGGASAALACPGSGGKVAEQSASPGAVDIDQLAKWNAEGSVVVIDANKRETYETNHIPGAKHVDAEAVTVEALGADKNARLAFYCYNERCGASKRAAKAAMALGYTNVFVLEAGIEGWKKAGQPVAKAESAKDDKSGQG